MEFFFPLASNQAIKIRSNTASVSISMKHNRKFGLGSKTLINIHRYLFCDKCSKGKALFLKS